MIAHSLTTQHIGDPITPPPPDGEPVVTVPIKKYPPDQRCARCGFTLAIHHRWLFTTVAHESTGAR